MHASRRRRRGAGAHRSRSGAHPPRLAPCRRRERPPRGGRPRGGSPRRRATPPRSSGFPSPSRTTSTSPGCPPPWPAPSSAYVPSTSAPVVQRLVDAGALFIGKVNLDQLATGLVGARSPYGTPTNPFDARMIPGGSSSGSGVAVAAGHVSFALGTDTAGSGRVPAGFNNVVGLKPTRGALSTRGVVPACRSFDCVSVFALTVDDASSVAAVAKHWDELDPFSRGDAQAIDFEGRDARATWRIGVPPREQLVFLDDQQARAMFHEATERVRAIGCTLVEDRPPAVPRGRSDALRRRVRGRAPGGRRRSARAQARGPRAGRARHPVGREAHLDARGLRVELQTPRSAPVGRGDVADGRRVRSCRRLPRSIGSTKSWPTRAPSTRTSASTRRSAI